MKCFLLYTTPPRFAGALLHSRFHQGWDMGRRDDVYVFPTPSTAPTGPVFLKNISVDTWDVDARVATALRERGNQGQAAANQWARASRK
jgi:hypothetical protein